MNKHVRSVRGRTDECCSSSIFKQVFFMFFLFEIFCKELSTQNFKVLPLYAFIMHIPTVCIYTYLFLNVYIVEGCNTSMVEDIGH